MEKIELKELLAKFTSAPLDTLGFTFHLIVTNVWENKWRILVLLVLIYIVRWTLFKIISSMIPTNSDHPKIGHIMRKIFLRKVTDPEGRLRKRTVKWFKPKNRRNVPRDKYNEIKDQAYYSRRTERAAGAASLIKSCLNFIIIFSGTLIFLGQIGITIGAQTAGWIFGFLSIALALGVQNIVKDVIGGVHVLVEDQYGLGDYIDAQFGVAGIVTHIGLRTTRLKGTDGTIYHIRHSEMAKIGNKTQATGTIVTDIEFTFNDPKYEDIPMVTMEDYKFIENTLMNSIRELRSTLNAVDRVALNKPQPIETSAVPLTKVAEIVPSLVPTLTDETLVNLQAIASTDIPDDKESKYAHAQVASAIQRLEIKTKPILKDIEMLGLVSSESKSLTIRVKIHLNSQGSSTKALSLLRTSVFEDFSKHNISVKFEEVAEGQLI